MDNMKDFNEVKLIGTIERLQSVETKTGKPMASWLLRVQSNKFKCLAFGNLAETVLRCSEGERIGVAGSGSISNWKDNDGQWHNDFQVSAWSVGIDGQEIAYNKS